MSANTEINVKVGTAKLRPAEYVEIRIRRRENPDAPQRW